MFDSIRPSNIRVYLVLRNPGQAGKRVAVEAPLFVIGRDERCELRTKSHSVSTKHCVIVQRNGRVYIKDLCSRNGTYLNGQQLECGCACRVFHRDKLHVGKLSMRFRIIDPSTDEACNVDLGGTIRQDHTTAFLTKCKFTSIKQAIGENHRRAVNAAEARSPDADAWSSAL